jgi:hypothetical protein
MDGRTVKPNDNTESNLSDNERIELIASLILEIVTEELLRSDGVEPCKTS